MVRRASAAFELRVLGCQRKDRNGSLLDPGSEDGGKNPEDPESDVVV